ncbi:Bug family tripartite tricarboxylate transporter substrate binding protein [Roseomonas sp. BN140053]|uniref:Bug family tripartite tricarboxylate transporter substrate binding protein n=1 Tax=Roseomonas sp. BN140053 TaxID=3391898 RepID=UPI0039E8A2D9
MSQELAGEGRAVSTAGPQLPRELPGRVSLSRRAALTGTLALPFLANRAASQGRQPAGHVTWPSNRPVRVIVPLAAGGTSDFLARSVGARLQEMTGQSFAVENRTGGGQAVGWQAGARAVPDGTTVTMCDNSLPLAVALGRDLGFDPRAELAPVTMLAEYAPILMVNPSLPVRDLREFVAYAKDRPGQLFYGSNGVGAIPHLQAELLQDVAGIRLNHVSYRGLAQAATDLMAGQIHLVIAAIPTILGQMRSGTLRAIAVATQGPRVPAAADVPSAREQGIDFTSTNWFGMMAPQGTPPDIVASMQTTIAAALGDPDLRRRIEESGGTPASSTPDDFRHSVDAEIASWTRIVREKNIKAE